MCILVMSFVRQHQMEFFLCMSPVLGNGILLGFKIPGKTNCLEYEHLGGEKKGTSNYQMAV